MKGEKDSLEDGGDDERREGGERLLVGRRRLQRLGVWGEMIDGKGKSDETRCWRGHSLGIEMIKFFCQWTGGWFLPFPRMMLWDKMWMVDVYQEWSMNSVSSKCETHGCKELGLKSASRWLTSFTSLFWTISHNWGEKKMSLSSKLLMADRSKCKWSSGDGVEKVPIHWNGHQIMILWWVKELKEFFFLATSPMVFFTQHA